MRVTSSLWIDALVRRCGSNAVPIYVAKRGAREAGAIFIRIEYEDRLSDLLGPAPQTHAAGPDNGDDRRFERVLERANGLEVLEYLEKQKRFDDDLWIIDIEFRRNRTIDEIGLAFL